MPILIDYSEIGVGQALKNLNKEIQNQDHSLLPLIRHQVFNKIKWINNIHGVKYGEIIISCDSRKYWRKELFSYYKGNRKKTRSKSKIDFDLLFSFVNTIKEELINNFPYRIIEVATAESDDVIASICKHVSTDEKYFVREGFYEVAPPILVYSSDNDFLQLSSRFPNVDIFAMDKKEIQPKLNDLELSLFEKCIRGEASDGIPNVISDDDCLVAEGKRQKSIYETWINPILKSRIVPEELKAKYERNRKLIDFEFIPQTMHESIVKEFESYVPLGNSGTMWKYFMDQGMMQHLEEANKFLNRK